MKLFSFEKLVVWQESRQLAVSIYKTTKSLPTDERFGLVSQMHRCSVSISPTYKRKTKKNYSNVRWLI